MGRMWRAWRPLGEPGSDVWYWLSSEVLRGEIWFVSGGTW